MSMFTMLTRIPKPALFAVVGAAGCRVGALTLEPLVARDPLQNVSPNGGSMLFPPEIQRRLDEAGARGGAIEAAMIWNTTDDLDLHCIEPAKQPADSICFSRRRSPSGGELDVDRNVTAPYTMEPVEHITWPESGVVTGEYRFGVALYAGRSGSNPVPFQLIIRQGDSIRTYEGALSDVIAEGGKSMFWASYQSEAREHIAPASLDSTFHVADLIGVASWSAAIAAGLALCLAIGQNLVARRAWPSLGMAVRSTALGAASGALAGGASQAAFGFAGLQGNTLLIGQCAAWSILGGALGLGMGAVIPNLRMSKGLIAGVIGGVVGGVALVFLGRELGGVAGRLLGAASVGAAIGLMVAVAEAYFAEATLRIQWAPKEESRVGLGSRPITFGSGTSCDVCLPSSQYAACIGEMRFANGLIEFVDKSTGGRHVLRDGSKLEFGRIVVFVEAKQRKP